jgi:hypothetical protein
MGASGRHIDPELDGLSMCQCQIRGSLPKMWHWENCESSCVTMTSQSGEAPGYNLAVFSMRCLAVDQDAVKFAERYETDRVELKKCLAYVRDWTDKERSQSNRRKRWVTVNIRQIGTDDYDLEDCYGIDKFCFSASAWWRFTI